MSDWVEINLPYGPVYGGSKELDSFRKRNLANPGTLIRMSNGNEFLIGDINSIRGVCDDCTEFNETEIVMAYRVVWARPNAVAERAGAASCDSSGRAESYATEVKK